MHPKRRVNPTAIALYVVAGLLLANLIAILAGRDSLSVLPAAWAQRQAPIAGGAGLFVMPAQLSGNTWGCYLMDVDRGTLSVYQFLPGTKQLQFVAARSFTFDTRLANFNTTPSPAEVQDLVDKQNQSTRGIAQPAAGGDVPGTRPQ
jgi:hypothetical protein